MPNVSLATPKPREFSSPRKSWGSLFEVAVFIVLAILVYVYLVSPKQKELTDRQARLTKLTDDEKKIKAQEQAFNRLLGELKDDEQNIAQLDQLLPLDSRSSKLYVLVEYLAQSVGIQSSSIAIEENSEKIVAGNKDLLKDPYSVDRQLTPIAININAIGTFDQLNNFLRNVENSSRLLDIDNLSITQGKDNQFIFKIGLKAYAFGPKAKDTSGQAVTNTK